MLRILVVEDDAAKLQKILAALNDVAVAPAVDVRDARDAGAAKRLVRDVGFDLLILDIALPDSPDRPPSVDGGIRLLEEIMSRDLYKRPREVIGLTAFSDVRDKSWPRFSDDLWQVVLYDPSSLEWASQIQRKVRHLQLAKENELSVPNYDCDLCIATALYDPELAAILALPWNFNRLPQSVDGTVYYRGAYLRDGEQKLVVAASAPRMGMTSASILAMKMIHAFRPRYLAMAGITAGIVGECSMGDVLVADPVWDWGSGKRKIEEGEAIFAQAPHQVGLNSFVRGKAALMASDSAVLDEIRRNWPGPKPSHALRMHVKPVASGSLVLADPNVVAAIRAQHRKLVGIDMETYGIFAAAEESPLPQPKAFSFKSVCDFADANKSDDFQAYASYTSASAMRIFVERYL